ncbi:MAG: hypothetical protein R3A13_11020 [Bdellovibrionota bacterium]
MSSGSGKDLPIRYRDIVERLTGFCARWPKVLSHTNYLRPNSEYLKAKAFLKPINSHIRLFPDSPLTPPLKTAIKSFRQARIAYARATCRKALFLINPNADYQPKPYLPRY